MSRLWKVMNSHFPSSFVRILPELFMGELPAEQEYTFLGNLPASQD